MRFAKTKLAAAIAAATLASSAQAVVVVGGDNGWEISFDGNVNLFYNQIDFETTAGGVAGAGNQDSAHLNEGLLPAFFSFSAKSPTVNGLTGTARISFAPDSSAEKSRRLDKAGGGALGTGAIDMREVVANVDGSFGQISFGRTLGLFGRQAILKDQTLFGVGAVGGPDGGGTTLGRIGFGYVYPQFDTRFAYTTPDISGFKLTVGLFDPLEPTAAASTVFETDTPRFEAEATYATTFTGGNFNAWVGGLWQEDERNVAGGDDVTHQGVDVGAEINYSGFQVFGHFYTGDALGTLLKWNGGLGPGGVLASSGFNCNAAGTACEEAENDGFIIQGGYTFAGKTKVAISYGESNQDDQSPDANGIFFYDTSNELWTVGVYHDVTSWLKLVAEYNNQESEAECTPGRDAAGLGAAAVCAAAGNGKVGGSEADTFSVGAFMTW